MPIILIGLNHRTAPIDLREQLSLTDCLLGMALDEISAYGVPVRPACGQADTAPIRESVILSTCNRLEVYAVAPEAADGWAAIEGFLADLQGISLERLQPHLYRLQEDQAVAHLMRVAAGLDSMILGECHVLGQVAHAFRQAQASGVTGPILSHLFSRAIHAGKRARTETDISSRPTSVSHVAARLAEEKLGNLGRSNVLVIGAGEMAELAALAVQARGAATITCINRTYARAQRLAERVNGQALNWHYLEDALLKADVIVSATSAPHTVISRQDVAKVLSQRKGRPLFIIDIAVPRDVEEAVGDLANVYRYDIDDLQFVTDANLAQRQAAVPQVETIVAQEVSDFFHWLESRQVVPVLVDLRRKAYDLTQAELERTLRRLDSPDAQIEETVTLLAHRIVNKLLHEPTVQLKSHAANGDGVVYAHVVRELFGLDGQPGIIQPLSRNGREAHD